MKKILPFLAILAFLASAIALYNYNSTSETAQPVSKSSVAAANLSGPVNVRHHAWSGVIVPLKGDRAQRKGHSDAGKVQNITADSFEIVWDKWDIEVYKKQPNTDYYKLISVRKK